MTPASNGKYTIMAVDDDVAVLHCYRRLISRSGYTAVAEADPMRLLSGDHDLSTVDLLVLDYRMPGIDGLSLLAELRRRECPVRCILISAYLNEGVRQQAELLGVDRVLEKPVDVTLLRSALAELLPINGGRAAGAAG